ncbi:MAG: AAA family ATPase [Lachnospiraceae bacterium]|nr:AAA family ATPase [Lachnospiraceae bacterium]
MIYLNEFCFPNEDMEFAFLQKEKRTCFDSFYPFGIFTSNNFQHVEFEPITIFYGGNGTGKSTALNIIADKLAVQRDSVYNKSSFFDKYVSMCSAVKHREIPLHSRIITSDDVFDYILNIRNLNSGIDLKRDKLFDEFLQNKYADFRMKTLDDYDKLKKINLARRTSQSKYIRKNLIDNTREYSNGESAFLYFTEKIKENSLYLLDEPENSLSPKKQLELVNFLQDSARFFGCQFIISTHSPFILSMKNAKIYNLDLNPVQTAVWTKLENVRVYYDFFKEHEAEF